MASMQEEKLQENLDDLRDSLSATQEFVTDVISSHVKDTDEKLKNIHKAVDGMCKETDMKFILIRKSISEEIREKCSALDKKMTDEIEQQLLDKLDETELKLREEITSVNENINEMKVNSLNSVSSDVAMDCISHSTPSRRKVIPTVLEDVKEPLRSLLRKYFQGKVSLNECLTPVQLAYVTYWFVELLDKSATLSQNALNLIGDGTKNDMWPSYWRPPRTEKTFNVYIMEKMKTIRKRRTQSAAKDKCQATLKKKIEMSIVSMDGE